MYKNYHALKMGADIDEESIKRHGRLYVDDKDGIYYRSELRSFYVNLHALQHFGKVVKQKERIPSGSTRLAHIGTTRTSDDSIR